MNQLAIKFLVGFSSALVVPVAKLYQQGLDLHNVDGLAFLGACIPVLLMGLLVGGYAIVVKRNEDDLKKIFEVCVLMPGIFVSFASGKPLVTVGDAPAQAAPHYVEVRCEPATAVSRGMAATMDALTSTSRMKYWILADKPDRDEMKFVVVNGKRYYIKAQVNQRLKGVLQYDEDECRILTD